MVASGAGLVGLLGSETTWAQRGVISTFGIRSIGSFFYLAFPLNEATFKELELLVAAPRLWAILGFVVLASIVLHGATANVVMSVLDRQR